MSRPARAGEPPGRGERAADHIENAVARIVILLRGAALIGMAIVVSFDFGQYREHWLGAAALIVAVFAESGLLIAAVLRARRIRPAWATADLGFQLAALVAGAAITAPYTHRLFYMYPYTLLSAVLIGAAYRRLGHVLAATTALAATYAGAVLTLRHGQENVAINALSYFTNTSAAWGVARVLRRNGLELDTARALAAEYAQEAERNRHARMMHDHVLQTLEIVVARHAIADTDLHRHVAADADWLRAYVTGSPTDQPGDLLWRLQDLVRAKARTGLRVAFTNTHLLSAAQSRRTLPPHITEAVVGAVGEALTNTAKHAGVTAATLRVKLTDAELVVTVLDAGTGFDTERRPSGIGLQRSIIDRIQELAGTVRIESSVGEGTYIEMRLPVPA